MVKVDKDDLIMAMGIVESGEQCGIETLAYVCRQTGKVWITGFDDDSLEDEDLPDDLHVNDLYVAAPDKHDLSLGSNLALDFATEKMANDCERVYGFFRRKGAYSKFKHLVAERELLEDWYQFELQQTEAALQRWCESQGLAL